MSHNPRVAAHPQNSRVAAHPIAQHFLDRFSPRALTGETLPLATLNTLFEAARWAPSSYNSQPWRFVYALRGTPHFDIFLGLLVEANQAWAKNASALVILVSKTTMRPPGSDKDVPTRSHSLDAGAAWENLALQASISGWVAHAMVGFDVERTRTALNIPAEFHVEAAIAIGKHGDKSLIPEKFHPGEAPNSRLPITETTFEGGFPKSA